MKKGMRKEKGGFISLSLSLSPTPHFSISTLLPVEQFGLPAIHRVRKT
jgi:hypothetical protein